MENLQQLALAADTRATGLAGLLATAAAALIAGGFTVLFGKDPISTLSIVLGAAAFAASICFIVALWHAIAAARPSPFAISGSDHDSWDSDADRYGELSDALMGQAQHYQNRINRNRASLRQGATHIDLALRLVILAPIAAIAVGLAAYVIRTYY